MVNQEELDSCQEAVHNAAEALLKLNIGEQGCAISDAPSAISEEPSAISDDPSAISDDPSAISDDPSAFLKFVSHNHAIEVLKSIGFMVPEDVPIFDSKTLIVEMKELLDGVEILDMSSTIPETPSAAYQAITVSALNAACCCKKDKNVAFLIMRSASNTPSFLFGTHWGMIQSYGKHKTDELMQQKRTPAAYIFFGDRQICLSNEICSVDAKAAARMISLEMTAAVE